MCFPGWWALARGSSVRGEGVTLTVLCFPILCIPVFHSHPSQSPRCQPVRVPIPSRPALAYLPHPCRIALVFKRFVHVQRCFCDVGYVRTCRVVPGAGRENEPEGWGSRREVRGDLAPVCDHHILNVCCPFRRAGRLFDPEWWGFRWNGCESGMKWERNGCRLGTKRGGRLPMRRVFTLG